MTAPQQQSAFATAAGAQAAQAGLATLTEREVRALLSGLDLAAVRKSPAQLAAALWLLIQRHGRAAGSLSAAYYRAQRELARILGRFTVPIADPAPVEQVAKSLRWAISPTLEEPEPGVWENKVVGFSQKLVLDVGRDTVIEAVRQDRRAKAWARVPEPDCCDFCALLSTRGAVYKDEAVASFQTHDHCRCHVEPVFTAYEPTAQIREWQSLYAESTRGVHGMRNLQAAFRKAYRAKYSPPAAQ